MHMDSQHLRTPPNIADRDKIRMKSDITAYYRVEISLR